MAPETATLEHTAHFFPFLFSGEAFRKRRPSRRSWLIFQLIGSETETFVSRGLINKPAIWGGHLDVPTPSDFFVVRHHRGWPEDKSYALPRTMEAVIISFLCKRIFVCLLLGVGRDRVRVCGWCWWRRGWSIDSKLCSCWVKYEFRELFCLWIFYWFFL